MPQHESDFQMGTECSSRPAMGLRQCLPPSASRSFLGLFVSGSGLHKEAALPPLTGAACPFSGTTPKAFFPVVFPSSQTWTPPPPPPASPLRDADPTCQALPCAELYYVSALLTPKSPRSVKNVPSGLWLTLPLSSKCFLSATHQAVARAKQNLIVSPSFLQPICLHPQNGLSATAARYTKGPELFTGAAFPSSSPHSADRTPATGKYSCQKYPNQGNKCFATPLQLACTPRRGEALDFSVLLAVC